MLFKRDVVYGASMEVYGASMEVYGGSMEVYSASMIMLFSCGCYSNVMKCMVRQ